MSWRFFIAEIVELVEVIIWPVLLIVLVCLFRKQISAFFEAFTSQLKQAKSLKIFDVEIIGKDISEFQQRKDSVASSNYLLEPASSDVLEFRKNIYAQSKNIFLTHRVRPTDRCHVSGLPYFDISIYLVPHKNYGALNDIKQVEYYLGHHFDPQISEYGGKYIVTDSLDGFAIKNSAYGPTLCEAKILFHDGTSTTLYRYLDFEETAYRFNKIAVHAADEKVQSKGLVR